QTHAHHICAREAGLVDSIRYLGVAAVSGCVQYLYGHDSDKTGGRAGDVGIPARYSGDTGAVIDLSGGDSGAVSAVPVIVHGHEVTGQAGKRVVAADVAVDVAVHLIGQVGMIAVHPRIDNRDNRSGGRAPDVPCEGGLRLRGAILIAPERVVGNGDGPADIVRL